MRFVSSLYRVCAVASLVALCACSTYRSVGSERLFSRETVVAFYSLAPGEQCPGPLYRRVMTFSPTALFVADPSRAQDVWRMLTPETDDPSIVPEPEQFDFEDVGVVHVSHVADLRRFFSDPAQREDDLADAAHTTRPWKVVLLSEPVLAAKVSDGFDDLARLLEQHGILLALSPGGGYMRSKPVGSLAATAVRYVALPSNPAAAAVEAPWLTRSLQGGRYAVLRAATDRLSWSLYDADGKLLDLLIVRPDSRASGASDLLLTSEVTALMKYGTGEETTQP